MALDFFSTVILVPAAVTGELIVALGRTTYVGINSAGNVTFFGIQAVGGNFDGMVVCISSLNNSSLQVTCAHESASASALTSRMRNAGLTDVSGGTGAGALWYRFNTGVSGGRWMMIGKTS